MASKKTKNKRNKEHISIDKSHVFASGDEVSGVVNQDK
jgi:hypothetical protein